MDITRIVKSVILIFLGINGIRDVKKKEIFLPFTIFAGAAGLCYTIGTGTFDTGRIFAAGIAASFLPVSFLSGGQFGMGDALVLLALGTILPVEELVFVIGSSFLLAFAAAAVVFFRDRNRKKYRLPFIPFLLAGYFGGLLLW